MHMCHTPLFQLAHTLLQTASDFVVRCLILLESHMLNLGKP